MGQCLYRTEYNKWERSPSNNIIKKLCTMYIVSNIQLTRHLNIVYSIHFNLEFVTLFGTLKTQLKLDTFERKITSPVNLNCLSYWLNLPWVYSTSTSQTQVKHKLHKTVTSKAYVTSIPLKLLYGPSRYKPYPRR